MTDMMPAPVTVVLLGEPVAWARTRLGQRGILFTPKKQRNNGVALKLLAQQEMLGRQPLTGPLQLDVHAEFRIPQSFSKAKRQAAILGELRPTKKPDLSNIIKQIEDAFNGIVFVDDAQIVQYGSPRKVYGEQPRIVATIREIGPLCPMKGA